MKSIFAWSCSLLLCISFLSCIPPRTFAFAYVNSAHTRFESPHRIQKIYLDDTFGQSDRAAIQDALDQWSYALNGYIEFQMVPVDVIHGSLEPLRETNAGKAWMFMKIDSNNAFVVFHDRPMQPALAFCEKIGGNLMYMVRDRVDNNDVKGITMHEIGHLLGAQHMDESDDLMNPRFDDANSQCIDKHTLEQVAIYQKIPMENMNYCIYSTDTARDEITTVIVTVD